MNDEITLQITEIGTIRSIYKDGQSQELKDLLEAKMTVGRASHVEWEDLPKPGWTVRACHDPELAIRFTGKLAPLVLVSRQGEIICFDTREAALKYEVEHFWDLLPTGNL